MFKYLLFLVPFLVFCFLPNESQSSLSDIAMGVGKKLDREDLEKLKKEENKVSSQILSVVKKIQSQGITRDTVSELKTEELSSALVKVNQSGSIQVYIYVDEVTDEYINALSDLDVSIEITNEKLAIIQGWIPFWKIDEVSNLDFVIRITAPSYGTTLQGSVTTEGDSVVRADDVRDMLDIDGSGVTVGVISDGVQNRASSQATGDLPGEICIVDPGGGDEGTAMLEIIYDIAPGSHLAFSPTGGTTLGFIQSIDDLITICDVDVIVDDIKFFAEPYYEDGPVADAVSDAIKQGVLFVSAAGNEADGQHYQALYEDTNPVLDANMGNPLADFHDFGIEAGDVSDIGMPLLIGPGEVVTVFLQWNDQALGDVQDNVGLSSNDYDLILVPFTANFLCDIGQDIVIGCASVQVQDGSQDPFEAVSILNTSIIDPLLVDVGIDRFSGDPRTLELFINGNGIFADYSTSSDSVSGHQAVQENIAVGAVPWDDPLTVEPLSSQGPSTIFFPSFVERPKPDIVAPNNVSITGAGGFPIGSPGIFPGTSASAPHVAGVAALILEADSSLTPAEVKNAMTSTADDIVPNLLASTSSLNNFTITNVFDTTSGFGLVDALAAVQSVLPSPSPTPTPMPTPSPTPTPTPTPTPGNGDSGGGGGGGCTLSQTSNLNIAGSLLNMLILLIPITVILLSRGYSKSKLNSKHKRYSVCILILTICLYGCVPALAGGMIYGSVKSKQERQKFMRNFNITNMERTQSGLPPLDLCTEKYNFDKYWAMEDPNCKEIVERLDPNPEFNTREAEELDKLGTR